MTAKESNQFLPIALTIAGSDSSGGAGIQADLKAFAVCNVYGSSVITCITAQNTNGVQDIRPLNGDIIAAQLDSVLTDLKPQVIKTGMLFSSEIVRLVADKIKQYKKSMSSSEVQTKIQLVVDPVMVATSGDRLSKDKSEFNEFLNHMKNQLMPLATIITPNLHEAEWLLGKEIRTQEDIENSCKELLNLGSKYVLLKGGHVATDNLTSNTSSESENMVTDYLYNGQFFTFKSKRLPKDVHGTGCLLASLIAGGLAKGYSVVDAVSSAKRMITRSIENSLAIGKGVQVANINPRLSYETVPDEIQISIAVAADELVEILTLHYIPEVGINIGFAAPHATSTADICALSGRIVRVGEGVGYLGSVKFGTSKHIARIILAAMKKDKEIRSAMNIKYRPEIIEKCEQLKFTIGNFNRESEPAEISSMEWGTTTVIENLGYVPDIIFDTGGIGKEPMIRILGETPTKVLNKLKRLIEY
jgi:hydroxymethylpyrimidine/phosphomethylpyrimidine kinase